MLLEEWFCVRGSDGSVSTERQNQRGYNHNQRCISRPRASPLTDKKTCRKVTGGPTVVFQPREEENNRSLSEDKKIVLARENELIEKTPDFAH